MGLFICLLILSLPLRERGLKFPKPLNVRLLDFVAPFAGAWIEIFAGGCGFSLPVVAPFAGAWIEILPGYDRSVDLYVAPFAGAWIEI